MVFIGLCRYSRPEVSNMDPGGGKRFEGPAADPNVAARFSAPIRQRSIPDRAADRLGVAAEEGRRLLDPDLGVEVLLGGAFLTSTWNLAINAK